MVASLSCNEVGAVAAESEYVNVLFSLKYKLNLMSIQLFSSILIFDLLEELFVQQKLMKNANDKQSLNRIILNEMY